MNPLQEYSITQGTVMGEVRHEIFQKYGEIAYSTAHYAWHQGDIIDNKRKTYTLVNSTPVKFLVATETFPLVDITPILNGETNERPDIPPTFAPDITNPTHLHLEWVDANIPFLEKDAIDSQGISYTLP